MDLLERIGDRVELAVVAHGVGDALRSVAGGRLVGAGGQAGLLDDLVGAAAGRVGLDQVSPGPGPTIVRPDVEPKTIVANLVRFVDELRVREVAWLDHPQGAGPLTDGAVLQALLAPDAGYLPLRLRVEGIDPGLEDDTVLRLTIEGITVGTWPASEGTPTGRWGEWLVEGEVRLPQRVEDDDLIDLRFHIDLPEGGQSVH